MDRLAHVFNWQKKHMPILEYFSKEETRHTARVHGKYQSGRRKTDPVFRMLLNLRGRVKNAMKSSGARKSAKTRNLIGCTIPQLRKHLEGLFLPGMSWANYGDWHIDHIRPCCSFDLLDPKQQRACFHFSNLQPLWAKDNFNKSGKWEATVGEQMDLL